MKKFIYFLLFTVLFSSKSFAIEGSIIVDKESIKAGEPFEVLLKLSYDNKVPAVLKGAPEMKASEDFKRGNVSSFSKSGTGKNLIFYRYIFTTDKIGEFTIGPAIVTYYTKVDPSKNSDEGLSLAEITKKAVEGEKQLETHSFIVNEVEITVRKISYLYIIYIVLGLFLLAALTAFSFSKYKKAKERKRLSNSVDKVDYLLHLREINRLKTEGNLSALYEKMSLVAKKSSFEKITNFEEKLEIIKFASYSPDEQEVEKDIRSLEQFIKSKEGEC